MKDKDDKLTKLFNEDSLNNIVIHQSEQENLDRVFDILTTLEEELSSDEEQISKKYLKVIKANADKKRAIHVTNSNKDKEKIPSETKTDDDEKWKNKKFSSKALRKILRKYLPKGSMIPKEEIRLMIWENDENLDSYLDKHEFDKMYKKCIIDIKEQEPKRLYYLILFLMFDKDEKRFINEEDTLEILYIRYKDKFEDILRSIFGEPIKERNPNTNQIIEKSNSLNYNQFTERMNSLSLIKRKEITKHKKDYCSFIHEILKDKGLPIIYMPKKINKGK